MKLSTDQQMRIMREHGFAARVDYGTERVLALVPWTSTTGAGADWESVPDTLSDLRDWLGY